MRATASAAAPPAPQVDLSKVAETYIKIRDAKAAMKREFKAIFKAAIHRP